MSPPNEPSPLTPEHRLQYRVARARGAKVRRTAAVARVSAWTGAVFAGLSILGGVVYPAGLLVGAGLGIFALFEFRGARLVARMDPRGPVRLALNQAFLAVVLCGYGAWGVYKTLTGPEPFAEAAAVDPALAETLAPMAELVTLMMLGVYGGLIVGTVVFQGLTAWYYASRRRHVLAYLRQTPRWILELEAEGAPGAGVGARRAA